jgi:hypothetical protein
VKLVASNAVKPPCMLMTSLDACRVLVMLLFTSAPYDMSASPKRSSIPTVITIKLHVNRMAIGRQGECREMRVRVCWRGMEGKC